MREATEKHDPEAEARRVAASLLGRFGASRVAKKAAKARWSRREQAAH
jgi:hypothetical protein